MIGSTQNGSNNEVVQAKSINIGLTLPAKTLEHLKILHLSSSILISDILEFSSGSFYSLSFSNFIIAIIQSAKNNILDNVELTATDESVFYSIRIPKNIKDSIERVLKERGFFYGENKFPGFNRIVRYKLMSCETRYGTFRFLFYLWFLKLVFDLVKDELENKTKALDKMLLDGEIPNFTDLYEGIYDYFLIRIMEREVFQENGSDKVSSSLSKEHFLKSVSRELNSIHEQFEEEKKKTDRNYIPSKSTEFREAWVEHILTSAYREIFLMPLLVGDGEVFGLGRSTFYGPIVGLSAYDYEVEHNNGNLIRKGEHAKYLMKVALETRCS